MASRSRLISSDNGATYTWVGLTRAEVLAMRSLLIEGVALANHSAVSAHVTMRPNEQDAIDDLMVSAICAGQADHGIALITALNNPQLVTR